MAETVLLLAIKKIGIALANEVATQAGAQFAKHAAQLTELQGSMGRVMTELRVMHDFLCQMDIRSRGNQVYQGWLEEVRKVVYVMEDMVDEYLHLVGGRQQKDQGCCFYLKKSFRQPRSVLSLDRISSLVKETEKNLAHLSQTKERWVTATGNSDSRYNIFQRPKDLVSISCSLDEEDLVGIEDNKQKLVELLEDTDSVRSIIVVHGMGGVGKTTLTSTVYRNKREKFECHALISVSQTYTRGDILRRLIIEICRDQKDAPSNIATMDMTELQLQDMLKSFLRERKYLIVLDDVWTPEVYSDLSGVLVPNRKGSRIIITTRNVDVSHLTIQERVMELKRLSVDGSWELFCKKAFLNHECPDELNDLSEQIVSKCEGLPLAIVSIGRLLSVRDKTKEEWKRIYDQLSWELSNNPSLSHVRNVLHLSFIYLPTHLKSCFLHCSLFPEDYLFQRKKLLRLWIAEGFIEMRDGRTVEEVAEGYIKELIRMNMLQLVERNSAGRIKTFRMHDIVRELAVDLCQNEFFGIAFSDRNIVRMVSRGEMVERRVVIHKVNNNIDPSILGARHIRSLIALDKKMPQASTLLPIVMNCKYMSVLELSGLPIDNVPDAIGELSNLRHLGLRDSKVRVLPDSIEKLTNLLTLDLRLSQIVELPRGIVKLKKLRHLFAEKQIGRYGDFRDCNGVCIPQGFENLNELQTLLAVEARDEFVKIMGKLKQMRSMRIWGVLMRQCKDIFGSLREMEFLSKLDIIASDESEVLRFNNLYPLPRNLQKLWLCGKLVQEDMLLLGAAAATAEGQNHPLHRIGLYWTQLAEDPLPFLARWSRLTEVRLDRAYVGEQLVFHPGWFPSLKQLQIGHMPNLKQLIIHEGTMTSLQDLSLDNLSGMTEVPPGIEFLLPTLKELCFHEITEEFLDALYECSRLEGTRWWYSLRHDE